MNYYPFHIGDYVSATRHLSWDEDAAYRRLLDVYYTHEEPIPLDDRKVFRLVMATTDAQREAVITVLEEFFEQTDSGWVNHRADAEILSMQDKQQKQRDKANKRWHKPEPERGIATALPRHENLHATASENDANAMPPTPTPTPTPTPEEKTQPLPFPLVREKLLEFAAESPKDDAKQFHAGVLEAMRKSGWVATAEFPVPDRGDGKCGRVDILVTHPCLIGIELDRHCPRYKSVAKLSQIDGYRVVMLRESSDDTEFPGIDAAIGCADENAHKKFDPLAMTLPDCVREADWAEWVKYRRSRRLTCSEATMVKQLRFLTEANTRGNPPSGLIDTAIRNGWQGLFEPSAKAARSNSEPVRRQAREVYQ